MQINIKHIYNTNIRLYRKIILKQSMEYNVHVRSDSIIIIFGVH